MTVDGSRAPGMDWARYRAICDRPDVLSRWLLERTVVLLETTSGQGDRERSAAMALAAHLRSVLTAAPVPRPADHLGPAAVDMFAADLGAARVRATLRVVEQSAADGRLEAVLDQRSPAGFLAAWREYARHVGASRR